MVLELRGDHWVRLTSYGESTQLGGTGERASTATSAPNLPAAKAQRTATTEVPNELPRAALVFRDGHTEEVRKYVIVGSTVYTAADYWTTGSWSRKIPIADLDVPATLKLNQQRGTNFRLPSGPTEVMMRP
jgi:hypothetical protein